VQTPISSPPGRRPAPLLHTILRTTQTQHKLLLTQAFVVIKLTARAASSSALYAVRASGSISTSYASFSRMQMLRLDSLAGKTQGKRIAQQDADVAVALDWQGRAWGKGWSRQGVWVGWC